MSWNYENIVLPETAALAAPAIEPIAMATASHSNAPITPEEMSKIGTQINEYSAYPSITGEISRIASGNPEHLAKLVRELSDVIEAIKADPHRVYNVSPELKQAVEEIRQVEAQKPDPLNLLRNAGANVSMFGGNANTKEEPQALTLGSIVAPAEAQNPSTPEMRFNYKDVPLEQLGNLLRPNVPDVRAALGIERGGRSA